MVIKFRVSTHVLTQLMESLYTIGSLIIHHKYCKIIDPQKVLQNKLIMTK